MLCHITESGTDANGVAALVAHVHRYVWSIDTFGSVNGFLTI